MFKAFIERENEIFDILSELSGLDFVLIGGYAVSAYKHRFSVDADIVIRKTDLPKFEDILHKKGYRKTISKELENTYSTEFTRYEKKEGLTVSVDLLIGGMGIRQTNACISFDKLYSNSEKKKIVGIEKEIGLRIPTREMLIALKLNAGRLTDLRDVVALSENFNPSKVKSMMDLGNIQIVKDTINKILGLLDDKGFMDSYKGVFIEKKFKPNTKLLKRLI